VTALVRATGQKSNVRHGRAGSVGRGSRAARRRRGPAGRGATGRAVLGRGPAGRGSAAAGRRTSPGERAPSGRVGTPGGLRSSGTAAYSAASPSGGQVQKRLRSPQVLSIRATDGQNLASRTHGAGKAPVSREYGRSQAVAVTARAV
jgi:hypothetical protein